MNTNKDTLFNIYSQIAILMIIAAGFHLHGYLKLIVTLIGFGRWLYFLAKRFSAMKKDKKDDTPTE